MPSEKQYLERKENVSSILRYIRANGPQSRRQLSAGLSLSWGCISELVTILISKKILIEDVSDNHNSKGRASSVLRLNTEICFLGLDVNKNGLKASVCNLLGEKIEEFDDKLNFDSKANLVQTIIDFVKPILDTFKGVSGIGFAMQGIFRANKNAWEFPSDTSILIEPHKEFENIFNLPIITEHDPNCILYGCFDKSAENKMVVRLDSGIGASVFKNGSFLKEELLEIGYFVVNEKGERLHGIISKKAIEKNSSEQQLENYLKYAGMHLGIVLGNVCNFLRIDDIYICGDLVTKYNLLNDSFYEFYEKTAIADYAAKITTVYVTDAAFGAAKIAMDNFQY